MDDLISRQAAIDVLDVLCQEHRYKIPGKVETYSTYNEAWQDALDRAEGAIGNLPSEQQWIPCSERLPGEEKRRYWVCTDTGYQCQCRWTNDVYGLGASDRWEWKIFDIPQYQKVTAWMPLPEPYQESEQDE